MTMTFNFYKPFLLKAIGQDKYAVTVGTIGTIHGRASFVFYYCLPFV